MPTVRIKPTINEKHRELSMQQSKSKTSTDESLIGVPSQYCSVCGDNSTGIHFGGNSCESCKAFFRRSVQCNRYQNYKCSNDERCPVNIVTRKVCQFCRYAKCTKIGMKPKWVLSDQEREEKYGSRRKRPRENRVNDEDPEIYKFLSTDEKVLIEDIAHALYQSRATYPLQFPSQLSQHLSSLSTTTSSAIPTPPPPPPSSSATAEKPPSPTANFLIVPIQRLVLFARMLKDFELFSEDDKVSLLKGSAIEVMVFSSNTLFNPKTHTFTNYVSRDQRAVVDDQVIPLDPLLKRVWGEDLFEKTKNFLISMCNLHVDEVTSTLLVPVILFSPDRSNVVDTNLVKNLQSKYASLVLKYMNWRYGVDRANQIYPKLLLQIVNIRTLGLSHAEVIQKVMSTSSVNPLVQEVAAKQQIPVVQKTSRTGSSTASTPSDRDMIDYDRASSANSEMNIGSDDEDTQPKKSRFLTDDDDDFTNEESDDGDPKNIWNKRRKLSSCVQASMFQSKEEMKNCDFHGKSNSIRPNVASSNSIDFAKSTDANFQYRRPNDHQVPRYLTSQSDDTNQSFHNRNPPSLRHLPPKKQSSLAHRNSLSEVTYQMSPSIMSDPPSNFSHYSPVDSIQSPRSIQSNDESHAPSFSRMSLNYPVQQPKQQDLMFFPPVTNATSLVTFPNTSSQSITSRTGLGPEEQQLLDAINAHPNKRDLVRTLLQQLNESTVGSDAKLVSRDHYDQQ